MLLSAKAFGNYSGHFLDTPVPLNWVRYLLSDWPHWYCSLRGVEQPHIPMEQRWKQQLSGPPHWLPAGQAQRVVAAPTALASRSHSSGRHSFPLIFGWNGVDMEQKAICSFLFPAHWPGNGLFGAFLSVPIVSSLQTSKVPCLLSIRGTKKAQ